MKASGYLRLLTLNLVVCVGVAVFLSLPAVPVLADDADEGTIEYFIDAVNMSRSANGDTIEVTGHGSFSLDGDGDITGRGAWVHRDPGGVLLAQGTWRARRLLSYETYGPQTVLNGLPPGSEGGLALIEVRMRVDGGGTFKAVFNIDCGLGDEIQDGHLEGTTVDPTTGPGKQRNFSEKLAGSFTLFVRHGHHDGN